MSTLVQDELVIPRGEDTTFSVYRDPHTSEISAQERTLAGTMAKHEATCFAEIACCGVVFARAHYTSDLRETTYHWILTAQGKVQLGLEHERLLERWRK